MSSIRSYHLLFRSPLHVGRRGVGMESTGDHVSADTMFSAICSVWRLFYGADSLEEELIDPFFDRKPPFFISSAFPLIRGVRFFPKPMSWSTENPERQKGIKRVRFISEGVLERLLTGRRMDFDPENCLWGGKMFALEDELKRIGSSDLTLRNATVPRVSIDRIRNSSEIWSLGRLVFGEGCGLWFAFRRNGGLDGEMLNKFDAVLRVLGDTGIGGERNSGNGLFDLETGDVSIPQVPGDRFMTLSPVYPVSAEEASSLTGENAAYDLTVIRGWAGSPETSALRRRTIRMFSEGSVLTGAPRWGIGGLSDVTPEGSPHPIWRYGYAFPVGMQEVKS